MLVINYLSGFSVVGKKKDESTDSSFIYTVGIPCWTSSN